MTQSGYLHPSSSSLYLCALAQTPDRPTDLDIKLFLYPHVGQWNFGRAGEPHATVKIKTRVHVVADEETPCMVILTLDWIS